MGGSHFIMQTSNFFLINTTAVSFSQGHGKVIQYILPDLHILWEAKVIAAADAAVGAAETNWKHKVTPDRGDFMTGHGTLVAIIVTTI